jgi:Tfp pilus assembly protein PilX
MMAKSARFHNRKTSAHKRGRRAFFQTRNDKGVALFISLMLLTLMSVMSVVMVMTVSPDMLINGYYGNSRGSFYAADSGLNIARQQLSNQIQNYVNMTACPGWVTNVPSPYTSSCQKPPLNTADGTANAAANAASAVLANVKSVSSGYGTFTSLNAGQAATSWPGTFQVVDNATCTNSFVPVAGTPIVTTNAQGQQVNYKYTFSYQLCAQGRALASQQVQTAENGYIIVNVAGSGSLQRSGSFASFGAFINNYPPCTGPLVPGTMEGPMFTNGAWQFENGSYVFTDPVSQTNANADFYFGSNCIQSPTASYKSGSTTIAPTFQQGLNLGQPTASLPPNDYSQKWAVLDGAGCGEGANTCGSTLPPIPTVINTNLNSKLNDINGNAYPLGGASSGVFLPYSCSSGTCTMQGGGIYVEGNASVVLSMGTDSVTGGPAQVYTITQGGTTTTITTSINVNPSTMAPSGPNYTTVTSGSKTVTLTGVPMNRLNPGNPTVATMLYVDGNISSLSGPTGQSNQNTHAIQDDAQVTIAANGNVNITGNVTYNHEPVTQDVSNTLQMTQGQAATNQVLGVFTSSGNINLSSPYTNNNLQVDGSLAAIGQSCASNSCGFTVSGSINTFNNVGGQIQYNIFSANMSTENTYFDRRFTNWKNFVPPWFPSTIIAQDDIGVVAPTVTPTINRVSWVTTPQ